MKIVIATPLYPPEIGGPATYAKLLEEGLPSYGIDVELVKFGEVRHLWKMIRHLAYFSRVYRVLKSADLVLALDPVSVGLPACLAAFLARKPFVVKVVGDYAWEQGRQRFGITENLDEFVKTKQRSLPVRLLQAIQTRVALRATRVIVPSNYLKGIVMTWGIPSDTIEVIYNAVQTGESGTVPEAVRARKPFVVSVGRLVPWKRFDGVIEAVAAVAEFSLVIVGDGPLLEEIHAQAQEKLGDRCLMTGELSHADTLAVMRESAALILNSTYEGLSHVLIEAQSLGTPAIVTDAGGNPEVITNGENGLVISVRDSGALKNALADFAHIDMAHLRAAAKENAKRFSTEAMLGATATLLKNI